MRCQESMVHYCFSWKPNSLWIFLGLIWVICNLNFDFFQIHCFKTIVMVFIQWSRKINAKEYNLSGPAFQRKSWPLFFSCFLPDKWNGRNFSCVFIMRMIRRWGCVFFFPSGGHNSDQGQSLTLTRARVQLVFGVSR